MIVSQLHSSCQPSQSLSWYTFVIQNTYAALKCLSFFKEPNDMGSSWKRCTWVVESFFIRFFSTLPKNLQSNQCNTGHIQLVNTICKWHTSIWLLNTFKNSRFSSEPMDSGRAKLKWQEIHAIIFQRIYQKTQVSR